MQLVAIDGEPCPADYAHLGWANGAAMCATSGPALVIPIATTPGGTDAVDAGACADGWTFFGVLDVQQGGGQTSDAVCIREG